jgi:DNA-binding CsgD family transcriptional regulator
MNGIQKNFNCETDQKMKTSINDFFKPVPLNDEPSEKDYKEIIPYIKAVELTSQLTYQSVYIIDYYKKGFLYVSNNPLFLCGNTPEVVREMGYNFYLQHIPEEDLGLLLEINQAGFAFYKDIKNIIQPNKRPYLINHRLAPYVLDKSGNMWLALCYVSSSSNKMSGNIIIRNYESAEVYQYDPKQKIWQMQPNLKLTNIEKEILLLSSRGLTVPEIALQLYLDVNTIKYHRKNIFKKFHVDNIAEALTYAENYQFI